MFRRKRHVPSQEALNGLNDLEGKSPLSWSVEDVCIWLQGKGFGAYTKTFKKNEINGEILFTLTARDVKKLGLKSLGAQKSLLSKVAKLTRKNTGYSIGDTSDVSHESGSADQTSSGYYSSEGGRTDQSSSSAIDPSNRVEISVTLQGGPSHTVFCKRTHKHERVLTKIEERFGDLAVDIFVGQDLVTPEMWRRMLSSYDGDPLILLAKPADPNRLQFQERRLLQGLADGAIIINTAGIILFINIKAEEIFGYTSKEIVGKHVSVLASDITPEQHDQYVRRYLETGNARIIGIGRKVRGKHKSGKPISLWLSLAEQKTISGRHTFLSTIHEVTERETDGSNSAFVVLDGVQEPVIVINTEGTIMFFNSHAETLLGYKPENEVGKNISTWMPDPYSSNHDMFLRNYLNTGKSAILGHDPRTVVALKADGSSIPVKLGVGECVINNERFYVGAIVNSTHKTKPKSLQEKTVQVLKSLAVPGIVIDKIGTIEGVNKKCGYLFGWKRSELLGKNIKVLMGEKDAVHHDAYLKEFADSGRSSIVGKKRPVVAQHRTGKQIHVDLTVSQTCDPDDESNYLLTGLFFNRKQEVETDFVVEI